MKTLEFKLSTVLAGVTGITCLVLVLLRALAPTVMLPLVNIPNIAALCAIALVADCWLDWKKPVPKQNWLAVAVFAVLTLWLMPLAAGLCGWAEALRVGVLGGALFTAMAFMFTGIRQKIFSGPAGKGVMGFISPLAAAFVLYLAFQAFADILL